MNIYISLALVFLLCIVLHEIGHIFYLMGELGKKPKTGVRIEKGRFLPNIVFFTKYPDDLTDRQIVYINVWGVGLGILPIFFWGVGNIVYFLLIPAYLFGCIKDFRLIRESAKRYRIVYKKGVFD